MAKKDEDVKWFNAEVEDFEQIELEAIDPTIPTDYHPGTSEKVFILAARYWHGKPLWLDEDVPFGGRNWYKEVPPEILPPKKPKKSTHY